MHRFCAAALALAGASARAAPAEASAAVPAQSDAGAPAGFRLEGRPAVDDVFGDASDYRRTIDRFLELTVQMQEMRDSFARAVQATLGELSKVEGARKKSCPVDAVAVPY